MRNWVISHLMWDPTLDEKKLTQEFLTGYYGKKTTPILLEYFDVLLNKAESTGKHIGCFRENTDDWLDYETLCKATALFDYAISVAENENGKESVYVQRLQRERLPLEHVWLKGYYKFKQYAETNGIPFLGPADPLEACRNFFLTCEKNKVTSYREYETPETFANYKDGMFRRFGKPAPVPDELKNLDANTWIEVQDYDFRYNNWLELVLVVDDPAASDGRAVMKQGKHSNQITIPINATTLFENTDAGATYKIVLYVRCDATVNQGLGLSCGIYDQTERKMIAQKNPDVSEIAGPNYQKIEFEQIPLSPSMYIWFTPPKREEVKAVYIDRVIIIKD